MVELDATSGFDFGARFIEIRNRSGTGQANCRSEDHELQATRSGTASIEWSTSPAGPWRKGWTLPSPAPNLDGENIERVLRWPEANVSVRSLPKGTQKVYVRFVLPGLALITFDRRFGKRAMRLRGKTACHARMDRR